MTNTGLGWVAVVVALLIGLGLGYLWGSSYAAAPALNLNATSTAMNLSSDKEVALYTDMRKLWSDHVWYTHEYITFFSEDNMAAASSTAERLLKNQEDIGDAVAQYYGSDAGEQLTTLLKEHISQAVEILNDAKANDTEKFEADNAKWEENANKIADFLASANPNWPQATLRNMMQTHLSTTLDAANAALGKDYDGTIVAFDEVYDHMNDMSDALSAGIIKQFPDKFR